MILTFSLKGLNRRNKLRTLLRQLISKRFGKFVMTFSFAFAFMTANKEKILAQDASQIVNNRCDCPKVKKTVKRLRSRVNSKQPKKIESVRDTLYIIEKPQIITGDGNIIAEDGSTVIINPPIPKSVTDNKTIESSLLTNIKLILGSISTFILVLIYLRKLRLIRTRN
jgi:hypothetical protein